MGVDHVDFLRQFADDILGDVDVTGEADMVVTCATEDGRMLRACADELQDLRARLESVHAAMRRAIALTWQEE